MRPIDFASTTLHDVVLGVALFGRCPLSVSRRHLMTTDALYGDYSDPNLPTMKEPREVRISLQWAAVQAAGVEDDDEQHPSNRPALPTSS